MKILNYGSMNIDNVYTLDHIIHPGETQMVLQMEVFCGGKGLNQSIAIAKAGGLVYHAGVVGQDGSILLEALKRNGVNACHVRQVSGASSHTVIQVDAKGQNSIIVCSGENVHVDPKDIDCVLSDFDIGDFLVLQNELDHSPMIMEKGADRGLKVVFNPSPINEGLKDYPLDRVTWFVMNEIEGTALTGEDDPQHVLKAMSRLYPNASVLLTLGADGAYCLHEGRTVFQPAFMVQAVDTTAAGDTFTGFFVTELSQSTPVEDAMRIAARASSITVMRKGAADSIPTKEEVMAKST